MSMVQADRYGKKSGLLQFVSHLAGQGATGGEEFYGTITTDALHNPNNVSVQQWLTASQAKPDYPHILQFFGRLQDGSRIHHLSLAVAVVAVLAPLRTRVGDANLGMGWSGGPIQQVFLDEAGVRRAVQRRQMRVKNQVVAHFTDWELAHVAAQEPED
jgi:hypothetical protein